MGIAYHSVLRWWFSLASRRERNGGERNGVSVTKIVVTGSAFEGQL